MADALCGPSNALQNAQKHASVDRTIQQDRLISRQPPAQGFRSQSPRDGILDPEFAAFETNLGGQPIPDIRSPAHFGAPAHLTTSAHPAPHWASDFQNLHISTPPLSQQQTPPVAQAQGGWHNEFKNQWQHQQHQQVPMQPQQPQQRTINRGFQPGYSMHNTSMNMYQAPLEAPSGQLASTEQFDDAAFEAAFAQAGADLELQESNTASAVAAVAAVEEATLDTHQAEPIEAVSEDIRIGSDLILPMNHDANVLAEVAGKLLEKVSHEQSQKFQQSNFLALMRRIRDREIEVEGEEFRETKQSLHPGGKYYPSRSPPLESSKSPGINSMKSS
ncbi:hypothetical protein N7495_000631 [Penicillium taxi]|uniref:uncharacterized protein n=1 Tax=Penicillium taxi TaxID=168475 RepID=UPI0025457AB2|nr:uncharacterized protein N7495_000631 [Penicillium taxi]KAJ5907949.1 hypothetical protein N7495_000631 [Penicillium taxi]